MRHVFGCAYVLLDVRLRETSMMSQWHKQKELGVWFQGRLTDSRRRVANGVTVWYEGYGFRVYESDSDAFDFAGASISLLLAY